jgi:hypothetical protein
MKRSTQAQINSICWLGARNAIIAGDIKKAVWIDGQDRIWQGEELRTLLPNWLIRRCIPAALFDYIVYDIVVPDVAEILRKESVGVDSLDCLLNNLTWQQAEFVLYDLRARYKAQDLFDLYQKCEKIKAKKFPDMPRGVVVKFI